MTRNTKEKKEKLPKSILNYRQAIDDSHNFQSSIGHLLENLTGMKTSKLFTFVKSKNKDQIYKEDIKEKAEKHMLQIVKQIPDGHIETYQDALNALKFIINKYDIMLLDEIKLRESKKDISGV